MKLILGSASVGRKRALEYLGLDFIVKPSKFNEKSIRLDDNFKLVVKLAEKKAKSLSDESDAIIITGDLFCVFEEKIYEKPKDNNEAFRMLKSFSGKILKVLTSVCLFNTKTGEILSAGKEADLNFRELDDSEIWYYVNTKPVTTFAAAFDSYGVNKFCKHTDPFSHVFPISKLKEFLTKMGISYADF